MAAAAAPAAAAAVAAAPATCPAPAARCACLVHETRAPDTGPCPRGGLHSAAAALSLSSLCAREAARSRFPRAPFTRRGPRSTMITNRRRRRRSASGCVADGRRQLAAGGAALAPGRLGYKHHPCSARAAAQCARGTAGHHKTAQQRYALHTQGVLRSGSSWPALSTPQGRPGAAGAAIPYWAWPPPSPFQAGPGCRPRSARGPCTDHEAAPPRGKACACFRAARTASLPTAGLRG